MDVTRPELSKLSALELEKVTMFILVYTLESAIVDQSALSRYIYDHKVSNEFAGFYRDFKKWGSTGCNLKKIRGPSPNFQGPILQGQTSVFGNTNAMKRQCVLWFVTLQSNSEKVITVKTL